MTYIHVVDASNRDLYEKEIEDHYRLRHEIFVEERGWSTLARADGREIDAYDDKDAVYLLAIDDHRVVGGQRLRPTTKPNLLQDVFPYLANVAGVPSAPNIWETTRYFVSKSRRMGRTDCRLLAAAQEYGLAEGITMMTAVIEMWWLPRWQYVGFKTRPLGMPQMLNGELCLAVEVEISEESLAQVRKCAGIRGSVLYDNRSASFPEKPLGRRDREEIHSISSKVWVQ